MAHKNRKISTASNRIPAKAIFVIALLAVAAIGYLSLQTRNDELGRQIKAIERALPAIDKEIANEQRNWTAAKSIPNMQRLLRLHDIEMKWPDESQIVRLVETPDDDTPYQLHASLR